MFNNILVVCVANICRSPIGDLLLQEALPNKNVSSAGINALLGKPMHENSVKLTSALGIDCSKHTARQLTAEICRENDVILVMEKGHIDAVMNIDPTVKGKIFLLGKWLDNKEIPDPYKQSFEMYERVFELIQKSTDSWIKKL